MAHHKVTVNVLIGTAGIILALLVRIASFRVRPEGSVILVLTHQ